MRADLNAREKRFCEEYVVDYNGTRAAKRAGYAEGSAAKAACRLLKRQEVLDYVAELQREQRARLCLTSDRVVGELVQILEQCRRPEPVMIWDSEKHAYVESGEYKFDSKGAIRATELLMKHLGMLDGRQTGTADEPVQIVDDMPKEDDG